MSINRLARTVPSPSPTPRDPATMTLLKQIRSVLDRAMRDGPPVESINVASQQDGSLWILGDPPGVAKPTLPKIARNDPELRRTLDAGLRDLGVRVTEMKVHEGCGAHRDAWIDKYEVRVDMVVPSSAGFAGPMAYGCANLRRARTSGLACEDAVSEVRQGRVGEQMALDMLRQRFTADELREGFTDLARRAAAASRQPWGGEYQLAQAATATRLASLL